MNYRVTIICILLVGLMVTFEGASQGSQREINVGFRAGYASTIIHGSYVEFSRRSVTSGPPRPVNGKIAFEVAASVYYQVYKPIFLTTGIGFIQKGGDIENFTPVYPVDITLNYLNVPLGVSLRALRWKKFTLFAEGGLIFNYEVSSKQDFKKGIDSSEETTEDKFILSYSFGGICKYRLTDRISIQGDVKFIYDINPFFTQVIYEKVEMKTKGEIYSVGVVYQWR